MVSWVKLQPPKFVVSSYKPQHFKTWSCLIEENSSIQFFKWDQQIWVQICFPRWGEGLHHLKSEEIKETKSGGKQKIFIHTTSWESPTLSIPLMDFEPPKWLDNEVLLFRALSQWYFDRELLTNPGGHEENKDSITRWASQSEAE